MEQNSHQPPDDGRQIDWDALSLQAPFFRQDTWLYGQRLRLLIGRDPVGCPELSQKFRQN